MGAEVNASFMVNQLRESLRIKTNALDGEIIRSAEAGMHDLCRVGVSPIDEGEFGACGCSGLRARAVEFYVKWQFDFGGRGEIYRKNYEALRDALSMSGDFRE